MRLLIYKKPKSPFQVALDIPSNKELSRFRAMDLEGYQTLFSAPNEDEYPRRHARSHLRGIAQRYLDNNPEGRFREANGIQLFVGDRFLGSGMGCSGFKIGGVPCSAKISEGRVWIDPTPGAPKFEIFADEYATDSGKLVIEFRNGTQLFHFFKQLLGTIESLSGNYVWIGVEF